jgi:DNA repair exonuclease SbcCD ATPase subunit
MSLRRIKMHLNCPVCGNESETVHLSNTKTYEYCRTCKEDVWFLAQRRADKVVDEKIRTTNQLTQAEIDELFNEAPKSYAVDDEWELINDGGVYSARKKQHVTATSALASLMEADSFFVARMRVLQNELERMFFFGFSPPPKEEFYDESK